ncbi:MAG: HNH endonuclease [Actinomycetota bacterium]|nr:HNH endonuclease [Actinomycetota bacterium]
MAAAPGIGQQTVRPRTVAGAGGGVLDALGATAAQERRLAAEKLRLVVEWAMTHPGTVEDCASWEPALRPRMSGQEDGLDHLGGEGTPAVAEFAVEQLATRLGISTGTAMSLVADSLNLAFRHPVLWGRVQSGDCPGWVARKIAAACGTLPAAAAGWVDAEVGHPAGRTAWSRIEAKIAYATAKWDPARTSAAEAQAMDSRHLDLDLPTPTESFFGGSAATAFLRGRLGLADAVKFEALVAATAADLAACGDTASLDVRRAKALGRIADRLITGSLDLDLDTGVPQPSATEGVATTLTPVGWAEKIGPVSVDLIKSWLGQTNPVIRPVLDLNRTDPVDAHDPPPWMRELVVLRDAHCVFPGCGRDARGCDLDHINSYQPISQGGPPGQTSPANLAPLCRRHHRCKTFTRWRYHRRRDGTYEWTDPNRVSQVVDPADTHLPY